MDATQVLDSNMGNAAGVLARAFRDDPGVVYILPDSAQRSRTLEQMFQTMISYGSSHGAVWVAPLVDARGVAIWLPPGGTTPTEQGMLDAGMAEVAAKWPPEAMERLGHLTSYLESLHDRYAPEPHWRLFFLGVEPEHQGKGIGGKLIEAGLQRIGSAPCYLETLTAVNVPLYERHGFRVVGEGDLPGSNVHVWAMKRG